MNRAKTSRRSEWLRNQISERDRENTRLVGRWQQSIGWVNSPIGYFHEQNKTIFVLCRYASHHDLSAIPRFVRIVRTFLQPAILLLRSWYCCYTRRWPQWRRQRRQQRCRSWWRSFLLASVDLSLGPLADPHLSHVESGSACTCRQSARPRSSGFFVAIID